MEVVGRSGRLFRMEAREEAPWLAGLILRRKVTDYLRRSLLVSLPTIVAAIHISGLSQEQVAGLLDQVVLELGDDVPQSRYDDLVRELRRRGVLPPAG